MSNADWWAKKLGQPAPQGRPDPSPTMPPSQQPMAPMPAFPQQQTAKAQSASQTATCPDCGSGNYFAIQNAAARCYDCGYPIQQSGSRFGGLAGANVEGPAQQATGNNSTNNWNPQGIIGSING
jgi:hypothetical protein